ncbi:hypothetical protein HLB44_35005 [Aquincola sp. S2]|uniref:Haem-binding uptake Tiki superfamily ChaN domain-containing protein n=1 Tax=Pseudaquabacterium terrae TaxID=2732868 RepID=A0ABX2EUS1_9BURK|nr:hypothetical protein [Aquabacterium terrae]NRF72206.1 hypothetical protein [Aquabacterium terrae]
MRFHRTEAERQKNPTDKERLYQKLSTDPTLVSLRERNRNKPRVEVMPITPYDKYPTVKSIQSALQRLPEIQTHARAAEMIREFVGKALAAAPAGKLIVILLGENHGSDLAITLALSTLHLVANHPQNYPQKKYLVEHPAETVTTYKEYAPDYIADFQHAETAGIGFSAYSPESDAQTARVVTNYTYAMAKGFQLESMDPKHHTAGSMDEREAAMVNRIWHEAQGAQVTVVSVGLHHLPALHERLAENFYTIGVMHAQMPVPGYNEQVKRASYALAKPDQILMVRPDPRLADAPVDAIELQNSFK